MHLKMKGAEVFSFPAILTKYWLSSSPHYEKVRGKDGTASDSSDGKA